MMSSVNSLPRDTSPKRESMGSFAADKAKEEISPELAAVIVSKYILPMFESGERKELRAKYNKMAGIRNATGRNL